MSPTCSGESTRTLTTLEPPDSLSILNDALLLQRRKAPPTVDSILADLQNVNELREKVMQTALEVATPLQLRKAYDSRVSR